MALFYIVLGATGSGRREVLLDLLAFGLDAASDRAMVLLPAGEPQSEFDEKLAKLDHVDTAAWSFDSESISLPDLPEATTHVFLIADGQENPVDQLELLRDWIQENIEGGVARIITVVHSRLLYNKPELKRWFEACVHFSDVVLFNRREDVPNKWFSDFEQGFRKECYPALFELVRKGRVRNPAEILYPEPRRMSLAFDEQELEEELPNIEFVEEIDDDDDEVAANAALEEEDEDEAIGIDPYFERNMAGHRVRQLPDIRPLLD